MSDQTGSWQPDPHGRHQYRWWDGNQWTDQVSTDGAVSTDPVGSLEGGSAAAASDAGDPSAAASEPTASQPAGWGQPAPPDPTTAMPAAGTGGAGAGAATPGTAPTGGPAPKKSGNTPVLVLGGVILLLLIGAGAWLLLGGDDDEGEAISADGGAVTDTADEDGDSGDGSDGSDDGDSGSDDGDSGSDGGDSGSGGDVDLDNPFVEGMIDGMMQGSDLSEAQARCVSEGLLQSDAFDVQELAENPDAAAGPEMMGVMFDLFEECDIDPFQMGGGTGSDSGDFSMFEDGDTYGDNPELDVLWDACDDGDGEACNELYMSSEIGSEYEEFGATCGGRSDSAMPLSCEE